MWKSLSIYPPVNGRKCIIKLLTVEICMLKCIFTIKVYYMVKIQQLKMNIMVFIVMDILYYLMNIYNNFIV